MSNELPKSKYVSQASGRDLYDEAVRCAERHDYDGSQVYSLLAIAHFLGEISGSRNNPSYPPFVTTGRVNGNGVH